MPCCLCRGDRAHPAPGTSGNQAPLFHNPNDQPSELLHKISPELPGQAGQALKALWQQSDGGPPHDRHENESAH